MHDVVPSCLLIRFNTHPIPNQKLPELEDRIKQLVQYIKDSIQHFKESTEDIDDISKLSIQYMFYGTNSLHMDTASRAAATFHIKESINCIREDEFDKQIEHFKLGDIIEEDVAEELHERVQEILGSEAYANFCTVVRKYGKRCGGGVIKGNTMCLKHMVLANKNNKWF
jgi:uncharacterized membrane-anchored protein YhcB (DUF1043 family)